jgi:hypothetical protein
MTASSPKGGRILYPASYQQADDPLDAVLLRNAIVNNALHAGDQAARVLVNWQTPNNSLITGNPTLYRTPDTLAATNTWYLVDAYGPWPISVWSTGGAYRLRVALWAKAGSGNATFAVALGPRGAARGVLDGGTGVAGEDALIFAATASAVVVQLTPSGGTDLITVSDMAITTSRNVRATTDEPGSPRLVDVVVNELEVSVWVKQSSIGTPAQLHGVHVAEFVG